MDQPEKTLTVFRNPGTLALHFETYPPLKDVGGGTCTFSSLPDFAGPAQEANYRIVLYIGRHTREHYPLSPSDVSYAKEALGLK